MCKGGGPDFVTEWQNKDRVIEWSVLSLMSASWELCVPKGKENRQMGQIEGGGGGPGA